MDKYTQRCSQLYDKITKIIKELKVVQKEVDRWYIEEVENRAGRLIDDED